MRSARRPKLDEIASVDEQDAWLKSPRIESVVPLREPPNLADDPYDDRLRLVLEADEWASHRSLLRSYIENSIFRPFETQPSQTQKGWWNITIADRAASIQINIWRQYVLWIQPGFDPADGLTKTFGQIWVDKQVLGEALGSGYRFPSCFEVRETSLKGRVRPQISIWIDGALADQLKELLNLNWMLPATRTLNLDLTRGGILPMDRPRSHVPKLVDAIFSEGSPEEKPAVAPDNETPAGEPISSTNVGGANGQ